MLHKHRRLLSGLRMNVATSTSPSPYMSYYHGVHWPNFICTFTDSNYSEKHLGDKQHDVRMRLGRTGLYSDTSANEDNSFRDHIRWPKPSLAETWFPIGYQASHFSLSRT
jgi:hypothetical protein